MTMTDPDPTSTHCPRCGAKYVHHQHPFKPLGAIWATTCECKAEVESGGARTTARFVPPGKESK